jgi:hypothetical protein
LRTNATSPVEIEHWSCVGLCDVTSCCQHEVVAAELPKSCSRNGRHEGTPIPRLGHSIDMGELWYTDFRSIELYRSARGISKWSSRARRKESKKKKKKKKKLDFGLRKIPGLTRRTALRPRPRFQPNMQGHGTNLLSAKSKQLKHSLARSDLARMASVNQKSG